MPAAAPITDPTSPTARRLRIHETIAEDGASSSTWLAHGDEHGEHADEPALVLVVEGEGTLPLPNGALAAVMGRFGEAFDSSARIGEIGWLALDGGARVRHVRHLSTFDVIARDYLVLERPSEEAVVALATTVAGALTHLGRAALARR